MTVAATLPVSVPTNSILDEESAVNQSPGVETPSDAQQEVDQLNEELDAAIALAEAAGDDEEKIAFAIECIECCQKKCEKIDPYMLFMTGAVAEDMELLIEKLERALGVRQEMLDQAEANIKIKEQQKEQKKKPESEKEPQGAQQTQKVAVDNSAGTQTVNTPTSSTKVVGDVDKIDSTLMNEQVGLMMNISFGV